MKTIQNLGFSCRVETINAVEAWRGSLPGDGYSNMRRIMLHTLNLADMLPITSVWAGLRENPSAMMPKHSPPLLFAATSGATPFRVNLHVSDLGHTLIVGPSGAGKSTALGLIAAQWFRYPRAQVFAFDRGYSMWLLTEGRAVHSTISQVLKRISPSARFGISTVSQTCNGPQVGSKSCAN